MNLSENGQFFLGGGEGGGSQAHPCQWLLCWYICIYRYVCKYTHMYMSCHMYTCSSAHHQNTCSIHLQSLHSNKKAVRLRENLALAVQKFQVKGRQVQLLM